MKTARSWHNKIAWGMGVVFVIWVVSGIVMILPKPVPRALADWSAPQHDYGAIELSPAEVVAGIAARRGGDVRALGVALRPLADRLVYAVAVEGGPPALVDALTGEPVTVTAALAEAIARSGLQDDVGAARIERVETPTATYPWGPLPAYRLEFENGRGTIAYVAQADGAVSYTDRRQQLHKLIVQTHDFGVVSMLLGGGRVHHGLLVVAGVLTLVLVGTGYYMLFWQRSRRRRRSSAGA